MRYAITGATGFVGGALARQLRDAGHEVRALVRDPSRATALSALGVELVPGDLDDTAALDRLCADVDGLFHVAGWYKLGQRDPSVGDRVNVEGTRNVLAAAQRAGVPKVVYTSTLAVNSDTHGEVYDETLPAHRRRTSATTTAPRPRRTEVAERFAADGLPVVIVQPGLVYGPGDTAQTGALIAQVVAGKRPQVPAGGGVCWAHVDDVAAGHVLAMEQRRARRDLHARRAPRDAGRGPAQVATIAGTKGPMVLPDRAGARRRGGDRRAGPRRTGAAGLRRGDDARRRWRRTTARPPRPSASSAGTPATSTPACGRPSARCASVP